MNEHELEDRLHHERIILPEGFDGRQEAVLFRAMEQKRRPVQRAFVLAVALALLICATALAADGLGLAFFWGDASPDAESLVERGVPQSGGQLDDATFTVREAVFDGNTLQAVVAVQAVEGKRAVMQGYHGNVSADGVLVDCGEEGSIEWAEEEDGTLLLYISQAIFSEEAQLSVTWPCSTALASADGSRWVHEQSGVLCFEVPRIEAQTLKLSATVDWSGLLTVTDVEVAYTPLGMDLQIRYVPGERLKNAVPSFYVGREEDAVNHRGGEISRTGNAQDGYTLHVRFYTPDSLPHTLTLGVRGMEDRVLFDFDRQTAILIAKEVEQ
ncbi:MAG: hypothetical protein UFE80_06530 [Christensenellales bacterium]|uniref:DUF4179 domain-containing protein n=1 Tax=Candidatus Avichristensenella intestinipullorum TaxID=2840693 RepID=A0A9D0YVV8_9FIRM|nr:hypothetical protein [Christensenellales bacterium]HIQ63191.1 hypothetical protein [Candidatus Avichristensenella intestinipullorum]